MITRVLAAVIAALALLAGIQTWRVHALQRDVATTRAAHAADRQQWADAARVASEQYRRLEADRAAAHREIVDDVRAQVDRARRDASAARVVADRLRDAATRVGVACGGPAPADTPAAAGGEAAAGPGLVLADVLGRADDVAGELAAALDAARAAGLACQRAYDALDVGG